MALYELDGVAPQVADSAWVADSGQVMGNVVLGEDSSVWFGAVLRGDNERITIGARTTNLIFIEPHKVFSRSIPNAGSTITQAIARDFNEPFGAAEERKKRDGFVSLGGVAARCFAMAALTP